MQFIDLSAQYAALKADINQNIQVEDEKIGNVVFKGKVEKKFVPSLVSRADVILIHGVDLSAKSGKSLLRFGVSPNKMFDALAAGRPIIMDLKANHNPAEQWNAGICVDSTERVSDAIRSLDEMPAKNRQRMCQNAFEAAKAYDFESLTRKLVSIIEG